MNGSAESTIAVVICLAIGGLGCFFGYKLTKLIIALCGFCFGELVGLIIGGTMNSGGAALFLGFVLGIVFAIFSYKTYKLGVFLSAFLTVGLTAAGIMMYITKNTTKPIMEFAVGAAVGIVAGVIAVKLTKPLMIITTSVSSGSLFGASLAVLIKMPKLAPVLGLVSIILGLIVQIKTNGGLLETEDEKRPSQNYAAPQYVNPYATSNNYDSYNGFGGQQQGYMNGQQGFPGGQQGYMNGQQGYMNGQPGFPNGQSPQDDGFLGNGHFPQ
ncbi:MAG: TMEM198/TM7SF3 family protein [Ruminococcus sp.]|nr:TMEM198/TM7SF3 family protein [Ruminococcus sp.]